MYIISFNDPTNPIRKIQSILFPWVKKLRLKYIV